MVEIAYSLVGSTLICHYGETNDIFPIGGIVQPCEVLTNIAIRRCRHRFNFVIEQNDRLYVAKALDRFMDRELVKITILITSILCGRLMWRARH